jgi:hypothetical protein
MGWAQYGESGDFTTIKQFANDESCFDGLTDTDVIGDQ